MVWQIPTLSLKQYLNIGTFVIIGTVVLLLILSSRITIDFLSSRLASTMQLMSAQLQERGMEEVEIEGSVSLGLIGFKVKGKDNRR